MTLRDWLPIVGALLIPIVIAVGGWRITWQQGKIENQRAKVERELAKQRAQDEALQAYFDQMSALLLEKDLRDSGADSEVSTLARARTLTMLGRLDPSRKKAVMQFLVEAELVQKVDDRGPIIRLSGANLSDADLRDADLLLADLRGADLRAADLSTAEGISNEDLEQATSLEGATMPDGQTLKSDYNPDGPTFKEWRESKGRGEDAENK